MKVLVDTSVWSLALRRRSEQLSTKEKRNVSVLRDLIEDHRVAIIGPIRQELLSGLRSEAQFQLLRDRLGSFPDTPVYTEDYETAARLYNVCRNKGVQGSAVDFLICAVALREPYPVFTLDQDFHLYHTLCSVPLLQL